MKFTSQTAINLALAAGIVMLVAIGMVAYDRHLDPFAAWGGLAAAVLLVVVAVSSNSQTRQWRQEEKRLRDAENMLGEVQRIAQLGGYTWDFVSRRVRWSAPLYALHGIALGTEIDLNRYLSYIHPEDRVRARQEFIEALKSGTSEYAQEYRIRRADGALRSVYVKAQFKRAANGRALYGSGVMQDITERTHGDEELVHMQQQLETAMRASRLSMWEIDFTSQTYSSKGWIHFLSRSGEFNNPIDQLKARAHPDDWPRLQQAFASVVVGASSDIDLQLRIRNPAGDWRWMHTQGTVTLRDAGGRALRVTGTHSDITDSMQQQNEIVRANERLDLALQGSRLAIWDVDAVSGRVYLSEGWAEMLGDKPQETFTDLASLLGLAHADDRERIVNLYTAALKGASPEYHIEHRVMTRDGMWKWILSHGQVTQRDANGRATRVSGTNADISGRKEIERMKNEFITVVSHELRTPLSSIVGSLGLLARLADVKEETQTLIRVARDNSHRLVRLINDILDVEKLDSDTLQISIEPVELEALLRSAIQANQGFADQYGVTLKLAPCPEPVWVNANFERLMQVMANLLSNAAKFSPRGAQVDVRMQRRRDSVRVSVADPGPGIPEDFKPRVFDRFAQADSSTTRKRGGTGLGLAICKMIIDRLGGQIGFASTPGTGATFYFDLQAQVQVQAAQLRPERRGAMRAP